MREYKGFIIIEEDPNIRLHTFKSLTKRTNTMLGICEQLRLTYDTVDMLPKGRIKERLIEQLIDVFIMGKKMSDRLVYYKKTYNDKTGHGGKNLIPLKHNAKRTK